MTLLPRRTAVVQVAAQLQDEIARGTRREWLPRERELCRQLQVSRSTLRLALAQLRRAGVTQPQHGVGHRIVLASRGAPRVAVRSLAMLAPGPLAQLRPTTALWMEELKDLLHAAGCELRLCHGRNFYQAGPGPALTRLLRQECHAGWILVLSTEAMQRWFMQRGEPCLIAGSLHQGIRLPSVDLDYRAIARHAVAALLRAGHRKIVFFNRRLRGAGEIESETGFLEAAQPAAHRGIEASIVHYDETLDSVVSGVRRLFEQRTPPTGLLIANSHYYLATVTELARRGLRIPADVSLVSRDDDPFLNFMLPAPARYLNDPQLFAPKLLPLALQLAERGAAGTRHIRILPRFAPGGSLGAPPPACLPIPHAPGQRRRDRARGQRSRAAGPPPRAERP